MRVWEIREGREREMEHRLGMRDKSEKIEKIEKEAYECGYEDGYEKRWKRWWEKDLVIDLLIVLDIVEVGNYEER